LDDDILQKLSENDESYDSIIDSYEAEMSVAKKYDDRPLTADVGVSETFIRCT
jgi:hypothetical protein